MTRRQVHLITSLVSIVATLGFVYGLYDLYQFSLTSPNVALSELPWGARRGTFVGMGVCLVVIIVMIYGSVGWMPKRSEERDS